MKMQKYAMAIAAVAGSLWAADASAQTFGYQAGDLLLGFRAAGGSTDLVVDLGSALNFQPYLNHAAPSQTFTLPIATTFGSLNNLYFSVFGTANGSSLGLAQNTVWLTAQRSDVNTQTSPSSSLSTFGQGNIASYLTGVANGANATSLGETVLAPGVVTEPGTMNNSGNVSYQVGIANQGNLSVSGNIHGTWGSGRPGIEGITSATFGTDTTPAVLDLYEQDPGTANSGLYLGSFTLDNGGTLSFSPVPEPSTWALFGAGLTMLGFARRFKRTA